MNTKTRTARLSVVLVCALLSGCAAVLDTSSLETAHTLPPGKVKYYCYKNESMRIHRILFEEELSPNDNDHYWEPSYPKDNALGIKLGVGITPRSELSYSSNSYNWHKIAYKQSLVGADNPQVLAVMPGIFYSGGKDNKDTGITMGGSVTDRVYGQYKSYGVELPLLATIEPISFFSATVCLKVNYCHTDYKINVLQDDWVSYAIREKGSFDSLIGSFAITPKFNIWKFVIIPEFCISAYPQRWDGIYYHAGWSFALGLDLSNCTPAGGK